MKQFNTLFFMLACAVMLQRPLVANILFPTDAENEARLKKKKVDLEADLKKDQAKLKAQKKKLKIDEQTVKEDENAKIAKLDRKRKERKKARKERREARKRAREESYRD